MDDLHRDRSPGAARSGANAGAPLDGDNQSGDAAVATESFESLLDVFWAKNLSALEGLVKNPPIFHHEYPNVETKVASFATPAKIVPSLLHHGIEDSRNRDGTPAAAMIDRLRDAATNHCLVLIGGRGCGKTRTLYEVLARNFGFYFVAAPVENGESKDFNAIVETLKLSYPNHNKVTDFIPPRIGMDLMLCALVSRLSIFSKVLELNPALSPLDWLVLQTECRPRDLFRELTLSVIKQEFPSRFLEKKFSDLAQELYEKIRGSLDSGKILFVVDDAVSAFKNRFRSDKHPASFLSQAVKIIRMPKQVPAGCILAGSAGDLLAEAQEMLESSSESDQLTQEVMESYGTFEDAARFEAFSDYLSGFLGPGDYKRLFQKYYQSRAGTIASALHAYIHKRAPRSIALEFLEDFAVTLATKGGSPINIPNSVHDTLMILRSDRYLRVVLREMAEAFYLGGKSYCFSHSSSVRLVDSGLGLIKLGCCEVNPIEVATREAPINKDPVRWNYAVYAMVKERIVQTALCSTFASKVREEILHRYEGLTTESERVSHFEKYCAAYILDLFSRDEPIEKMFVKNREANAPDADADADADSNPDPTAAKRYFCYDESGIAKEQSLELVEARAKIPAPEPGTPLMVRLGQNWTFERWFGMKRDRPTFLQTKTDNQFGPDFITIVEMPRIKKEILLNIQVRQGMAADRLDSREFFAHNKQRQVLDRNKANSSLLEKYWSSGWMELRLSPCKRLQHDDRAFPADKPCIRAYIDKTNLYKVFPKLLQHLRIKV